ncbi:MAG: L-histidine N(alpha)-methyltransferase [Actinomycetota bacterium]
MRAGGDDFRAAVLRGLAHRPRRLPCRFLYDEAGSALFDSICDLPEYPLTRAELGLLARCGPDIAARMGPGRVVVDLGAGSMRKTRLLLAALDRPAAYVPVDVAAGPLADHAARLAGDFPGLPVVPVVADFTRRLPLPRQLGGPVLSFFPGSTIGNLGRPQAVGLLKRLAALGGAALVGVDLVKPAGVLQAAYDDAQGVTAAFTLNLLHRLRRELGAEVDPAAFAHRARWRPAHQRIEISLVARRSTRLALDGRSFAFKAGEAIHVEDCHKYTPEGFAALAGAAGLRPEAVWVDEARRYSLHLLGH